MMKKFSVGLCAVALAAVMLVGCGAQEGKNETVNVQAETQLVESEAESVIESETQAAAAVESEEPVETDSEVAAEETDAPGTHVVVDEENSSSDTQAAESYLADGVYSADFKTDSSMFHLNETCEGKAKLTVENGQMTIHITLVSKNIEYLYPGTAAEAESDPDGVIEPTEDSVTYSDGYEEVVYGFDVPVPYLNQEFNLALIGKKENWYDHKVVVSNPEIIEE